LQYLIASRAVRDTCGLLPNNRARRICTGASVKRKLARSSFPMKPSILNIAHRGASGTSPENTLAAFRAAIAAGAAMCELDVQLTRDQALVVIHDDTVDRTTDGQGAVKEMTLAELKRLDAGIRFRGGLQRKEPIPTLDEVFAATAGQCALNIELKSGQVEKEVVASMRKWKALETSMVSSFDWGTLARIRELEVAVRIGVLAEKSVPRMFDAAARLSAYAINPRFDLVTSELCDTAHTRGLKVLVWTVDAPELMRLLIGCGVDGIMTNYPARLQDVLSE
jgi:glycerophosphoryl diester phosphodiesterase